MGQITRDQSLQILSALMTNTRWDDIDFEGLNLQDHILRNSSEAGANFTAFLKNRARLVVVKNPQVLQLARLFDPGAFIGQGWSIIKEESEQRSKTLTEVDFSQILLETCLKKREQIITGEEKLGRLKRKKNFIRLGPNVGYNLWLDYQANKEKSILEFLRNTRDITYLDFFGEILLSPNGNRNVLYLNFNGDSWVWRVIWLGDGWFAGLGSAGLAGVS